MNFRPELADKVMAGEKTVTRRRMSHNSRSPWFVLGCSLKVGRSYAVCPGRGKNAIGRVVVTEVSEVQLGAISNDEAVREGFANWREFRAAWTTINGSWEPLEWVWRIRFEVAA
ncbi:MAG TPA: ASCH domain-containing protein [Gemmatimonadales bacterium]|nr:ASCH domain-containing protein [Gemmatimonadales bacterium]